MSVAREHWREVLKGLRIVKPHLEHVPMVEAFQRLSGFTDRDGAPIAPDVKPVGWVNRLCPALHGVRESRCALKDCDRRPYEAAA